MKHYFVYGIKSTGGATEKRLTNEEHLEKCITETRHQLTRPSWLGIESDVEHISVNEAYMCFDGYYAQGEWLGYADNEEQTKHILTKVGIPG